MLPVLALDLNENDDILDMCASPGGKSMLIIQSKRFSELTTVPRHHFTNVIL